MVSSLGSLFFKAHTRSAAVLIKELHSSRLQGLFDHLHRCSSRLGGSSLQFPNGNNAHASLVGQSLLAPVKQAASGSALCRHDHAAFVGIKSRLINVSKID